MSMIRLIYHSTACIRFSGEELLLFLEDIRSKNIQRGVTGILLYHQGKIMQIFEGEKAVVNALFKKIKVDRRHADVVMLIEFKIEKRCFGNWAMAFTYLSKNEWLNIDGYLNLDDPQSILHQILHANAYLNMIINSFIEEEVRA